MAADTMAPFAALVEFRIEDFDRWKQGFEDYETERQKASFIGHHVNIGRNDSNLINLYLPLTDLERAREFAASDELKEYMRSIGITGPPDIKWLEPLRQDPVWDRELPAFIIHHRVADLDRWLEGYDAAAELQREHDIVGHAANCLVDDRQMVIVYHQAETFETLEAFLNEAELKEAMQQAGVVSEPEVHYYTGGDGKRYD